MVSRVHLFPLSLFVDDALIFSSIFLSPLPLQFMFRVEGEEVEKNKTMNEKLCNPNHKNFMRIKLAAADTSSRTVREGKNAIENGRGFLYEEGDALSV